MQVQFIYQGKRMQFSIQKDTPIEENFKNYL